MTDIDDKIIVIGDVYGTAAEHTALLREEGQDDSTIAGLVRQATDRARRGRRPGRTAVSALAYAVDPRHVFVLHRMALSLERR
jgi:hypothetical protein